VPRADLCTHRSPALNRIGVGDERQALAPAREPWHQISSKPRHQCRQQAEPDARAKEGAEAQRDHPGAAVAVGANVAVEVDQPIEVRPEACARLAQRAQRNAVEVVNLDGQHREARFPVLAASDLPFDKCVNLLKYQDNFKDCSGYN
jgi:hypothetical protein